MPHRRPGSDITRRRRVYGRSRYVEVVGETVMAFDHYFAGSAVVVARQRLSEVVTRFR